MCEIHIHPTAKIAEIAGMARRMNLKPVNTANGRVVLLTPNHERIQSLRNQPRMTKSGRVLSTWSKPFDDDPEPPAAA